MHDNYFINCRQIFSFSNQCNSILNFEKYFLFFTFLKYYIYFNLLYDFITKFYVSICNIYKDFKNKIVVCWYFLRNTFKNMILKHTSVNYSYISTWGVSYIELELNIYIKISFKSLAYYLEISIRRYRSLYTIKTIVLKRI